MDYTLNLEQTPDIWDSLLSTATEYEDTSISLQKHTLPEKEVLLAWDQLGTLTREKIQEERSRRPQPQPISQLGGTTQFQQFTPPSLNHESNSKLTSTGSSPLASAKPETSPVKVLPETPTTHSAAKHPHPASHGTGPSQPHSPSPARRTSVQIEKQWVELLIQARSSRRGSSVFQRKPGIYSPILWGGRPPHAAAHSHTLAPTTECFRSDSAPIDPGSSSTHPVEQNRDPRSPLPRNPAP